MKKLLLSALAIILAMGLMGSAFAYFSDTESSEGNTFTAGTWDLSRSGGETLPFQGPEIYNITPGWVWVEHDGIYNLGNVAGEVWITAENFEGPGTYYGGIYGEPLEPESSLRDVEPWEFAQVLRMRIEVDLDLEPVSNLDYETQIYDGPLYGYHGDGEEGMVSQRFPIDAYGYVPSRFTAYLPEDLFLEPTPGVYEDVDDNLYQADGVACDITYRGATEITLSPEPG